MILFVFVCFLSEGGYGILIGNAVNNLSPCFPMSCLYFENVILTLSQFFPPYFSHGLILVFISNVGVKYVNSISLRMYITFPYIIYISDNNRLIYKYCLNVKITYLLVQVF